MNASVCTLFEGHYHFGVAAWVNSLYYQGYRGAVYVGYRGTLPHWSKEATDDSSLSWPGAKTLQVAEGLQLHFLPVTTEFHLTNYKPFFMLSILEGFSQLDSLTYFDPDIVVKCKWSFFENWLSHGVALVHEISYNDMPPSHPLRMEWLKVIKQAGLQSARDIHSYINGGFCGVSRKNIEFLKVWANITQVAIRQFGLTPDQWSHDYDRTFMFHSQDQDTLNITAMCSSSPISEMGPEAMDFVDGGFTMSHCVGSPKPWKKKYLASALKGIPPSKAEKAYWLHTTNPILIHSDFSLKITNASIMVAALIGRFYKRA
jgi:hypothetical protein